MTALQYITAAACLLLAFYLPWKEWRRPAKARRAARIAASLLAVLSLLLMGLHPGFSIQTAGNSQAVLSTDGANQDSLDAFLKRYPMPVYNKERYLQGAVPVDSLHVFGYGLSEEEWAAIPARHIVFHPQEIGSGITAIFYNNRMNSGDQLLVSGSFQNASGSRVKLVLSGFGLPLDSAFIAAGTVASFRVGSVPKFNGDAVFYLTALAGTDTIEHQQLPVSVVHPAPLHVLLLAAFPNFENKFLQTWLQDHGHAIVAKTLISKNKFSYSFTDTMHFTPGQLSASGLQPFDLVIADGNALAALGKQELFSLRNAVINDGLGLLIRADSSARPALFFDGNCSVVPAAGRNQQAIEVRLQGHDTASRLPVEYVSFLAPKAGTKNLLTDESGRVLACKALYGNGQIVFSSLNTSYYWSLSGDSSSYSSLWALLLAQAARKKGAALQYTTLPVFPVVNKPLQLLLHYVHTGAPRTLIGSTIVSLSAHPHLPYQWEGTFWPARAGWHKVALPGETTASLYVYDSTSWKTLHAVQTLRATYRRAGITGQPRRNIPMPKGWQPVPPYLFALLFMGSCIFLWVERKLR